MVKAVQTNEEFDELMKISETKLVVIDFWATWCGPCVFIGPHFIKLAEDNPDVEFAKIDVDEADELAAKCGISAMPTFQFFKGGKKIDEMKGADKAALEKLVAKHK